MQRKTTTTNERYSAVNGDKMKTKNEGSDRKSTQTEEKQEDEDEEEIANFRLYRQAGQI